MRLDGLIGFDIDADDEGEAQVLHRLITGIFGPTPAIRVGQYPRRTLFYGNPDGLDGFQVKGTLDVLVAPKQCVAFNVHPKTGQPYQWMDGSPLDLRVADLPIATPEGLRKLRAALSIEERDPPPLAALPALTTPAAVLQHPVQKPLPPYGTRITDGRYRELRRLIWAELGRFKGRGVIPTVEELAEAAWRVFCERADLTKPKGRGGGFYTFADAVKLARASLKRERHCKPSKPRKAWSKTMKDRLLSIIERDRNFSWSAKRVAAVLLEHVNDEGIVFIGAAKIGSLLRLTRETVSRARSSLIEAGYFRPTRGKVRRATTLRPVARWVESIKGEPMTTTDASGTLTAQGQNTGTVMESVTLILTSGKFTLGADENAKMALKRDWPRFGTSAEPSAAVMADDESIRALQSRLGLTSEQIARRLQIEPSHLAQVEQGRDTLDPEARRRLRRIMGMRVRAA